MPEVTRRSFLQSMSAAFSAAALGVKMPLLSEPPRIRYELFTCPFSRRYSLGDPFSLDGSIYATDSRLLITHPGEWAGNGSAKIPDISKLWWGEFDQPGWKELPDQRLRIRQDGMDAFCPLCMGTGRLGAGVMRNPKYADDVTETELEWIGGTPCHQCDGRGCPDDFSHYEPLGNAAFCPALMNRLRTLGGLDYRVAEVGPECIVPRRNYADDVLFVRGDDGLRGILMSMDVS